VRAFQDAYELLKSRGVTLTQEPGQYRLARFARMAGENDALASGKSRITPVDGIHPLFWEMAVFIEIRSPTGYYLWACRIAKRDLQT
jgi:hypothetical protein